MLFDLLLCAGTALVQGIQQEIRQAPALMDLPFQDQVRWARPCRHHQCWAWTGPAFAHLILAEAIASSPLSRDTDVFLGDVNALFPWGWSAGCQYIICPAGITFLQSSPREITLWPCVVGCIPPTDVPKLHLPTSAPSDPSSALSSLHPLP